MKTASPLVAPMRLPRTTLSLAPFSSQTPRVLETSVFERRIVAVDAGLEAGHRLAGRQGRILRERPVAERDGRILDQLDA